MPRAVKAFRHDYKTSVPTLEERTISAFHAGSTMRAIQDERPKQCRRSRRAPRLDELDQDRS